MKTKVLFILLVLLFSNNVFAAEPSSFSHSGSLVNGQTITVSGANFGSVSSPNNGDLFDDYTQGSNACTATFPSTIWCVNGDGHGDPTNGSKWGWDGSSDLFIFFNDDASSPSQTAINDNPLLRMDSGSAMYSTGYGVAQSAEYKSSSSGGAKPNSTFYFNFENSSELYLVYYTRWDSSWDSDWRPIIQDKNVLIRHSDTGKSTIQLTDYRIDSWSQTRVSYINAEVTSNWQSIDDPTSAGAFPGPNKWCEIKLHLKMNTGSNSDGICEMWLNGNKIVNDTTAQIDDNGSLLFDYVYMLSNLQDTSSAVFTMPGSGQELSRYLDDVLIWTSDQPSLDDIFPMIACVYLSNNSTWGSGPTDKLNGDSNFIRQKIGGTTAGSDFGFMSWSDTGFKFELSGYDSNFKYLYVRSWDGTYNSTGYTLTTLDSNQYGIGFTAQGGVIR